MNKNKLKQIIKRQKSLGKTPKQIQILAKAVGISKEKIEPLLSKLFPNFYTKNSLKNKKKFWNPTGRILDFNKIDEENKRIEKEFIFFKEHPDSFRILLLKNILLYLVIIVSILLFFKFYVLIVYNLIFCLFIFHYEMKMHIKPLQTDLIKKIIADKKKFLYSPSSDHEQWNYFQKKIPEIFKKGTQKQNIHDEFWGFLDKNNKQAFYSSLFYFENKVRTKKHGNIVRSYNQTIFAFKLNKKIKSSIEIKPNILDIKQKFESIEFNNLFIAKSSHSQLDLFQKITPAVQVIMVDLAKTYPNFHAIIRDDIFLFSRPGTLFSQGQKTDFSKEVKINKDDEFFLENELNSILSIAQEIPKYLD